MPIANKIVLTAALTTMDNDLGGQFQAIGDPLTVLNTDQTLAAAIQADPGCATVLDFYKSSTTSGLKVGDCTTSNETKVDCTTAPRRRSHTRHLLPGRPDRPLPGNDALNTFADQTCNAAFTQYVGVTIDQSTHTYGYFSPQPRHRLERRRPRSRMHGHQRRQHTAHRQPQNTNELATTNPHLTPPTHSALSAQQPEQVRHHRGPVRSRGPAPSSHQLWRCVNIGAKQDRSVEDRVPFGKGEWEGVIELKR